MMLIYLALVRLGILTSKDESTVSFLEELHRLPVKTQSQSEMVAENPSEAVR